MKTSSEWLAHFRENLTHQRIDWTIRPQITKSEKQNIIRSLQAWQLGETSEGVNLIRAATRYAEQIQDDRYVDAIRLFIKEEQKHGENLGKYLDAIGVVRLKRDLGDSLFRKIRYLNTSMEIWTITVIIVERFAQRYYQAISNATSCTLLKQVCQDILIDEAHHIEFQLERLCLITSQRSGIMHRMILMCYRVFFYSIFLAVWIGHGKAFRAGGVSFISLLKHSTNGFNLISNRLFNYHKEIRFKLQTLTA